VAALPAAFAGFFRDRLLGRDSAGLSGVQRDAFDKQAEQMLANCQRPPDGDFAFALLRIGTSLAPFLHPAELEPLWSRIEALPCATALDARQRDWLGLVEAVGRRDGAAMAVLSARLFEHHEDKTSLRRRFLLGAGMLGNIAAEHRDAARTLWERHAAEAFGSNPPSLMMRILAAHAGVFI